MLDLKELCSWRGGANRLVSLASARDQHQVANIDDSPDALSCDEDRVYSIDRIGERDEPADQAHVPKRDRDLTLRLSFRGNPLDHPAAEKQPLAEKSDGEPDSLEAHGQAGGEGLEARGCASRLDELADSFALSGVFFLECLIHGSLRWPDSCTI